MRLAIEKEIFNFYFRLCASKNCWKDSRILKIQHALIANNCEDTTVPLQKRFRYFHGLDNTRHSNSSGLSRPTAKRGELYHARRKRDNCARPISSARTRQLRDALIKLIPVIEALRLPSSAFNPGTGTRFSRKTLFLFAILFLRVGRKL